VHLTPDIEHARIERKEKVMTVVAGVDESVASADVVARAVDEARWRNTDLHIVYVNHFPTTYTQIAIDWDEVMEAQRAAVWSGLAEVIGGSDVAIERVDLRGYPPDTLVDYASEMDASLLVVGTRGRGDLASLILGSTSHRAIHLAPCDVLVVKPRVETS
jgi:nucleotide-binding universal stress UspA family protein